MLAVHHAFEGRFSDSPRALFEALCHEGLADEHVWLAAPEHEHGFPPDVRTATWGTAEAREALEAADLLVANTHTDTPWRKKAGAVYLQTWHGTPLKRIHRDVLWAPPGRLDRLDEDVARWDLLVSPNRPSTARLRQAFRYEGEVLETGYPRNDVLLSPRRDAIRAEVRAALDVPEDAFAVLVAPTWRDDAVFAEGGREFGLGFDLDRAADVVAAAGGVLLLRLHYLLSGRLGTVDHPAVREVSFHPEVSDLYLAADGVVTDYSSVQFDFAVTGKPQVLYVPDLDDYADRLRGFYTDLRAEAPGPLLETEDDLLAALADLPAAAAPHAAAYAAFRERYCHLEDGAATARVVAGLRERLVRAAA